MGMVKGVDLGWLTQLEATKVSWVDAKGEKVDPLKYMKEMGVNGVRLRVFVNPPEEAYWNKKENERCMLGFCDIESVVRMAKRVKSEGLSLMIDIHYSDHFADPEYQDIPEAWLNEDFEGLKEKVTQHTIDVMTKLGEQGIMPDWVQVGNEINNGILRPVGSFGDNPEQLVELLNAGYDAVKEISPNTKVITHLSGLPILDWLDGFLSTFTKLGGKTDIFGFSYYPYWYRLFKPEYGKHDKKVLKEALEHIVSIYRKPVMIVETGEDQNEGKLAQNMLQDIMEVLEELPQTEDKGVFYWEPEVGEELLPDAYSLGACRMIDENTLQFNEALLAYR
ncbi:MAG: glycosyl hydrolase 53 family protein [Bacillota bacterium]|nr:glycosyl hydrolase 53 family protein [Bacillota bacterium]